MRNRSRWGTPALAALLSFLLPGLGQAAAGRVRRAVLVAIPAGVVFLAGLWVLLGPGHISDSISLDWLTALLVLDLVALAYHAWAILDAYRVAGGTLLEARGVRGRGRFVPIGLVAILLVGTLGIHGGVAALDWQAQDSLSCMFNPDGPVCLFGDATPNPSASDDYADETDPPEESQDPMPTDSDTIEPSDSPSLTPTSSATVTPTPKPTPAKTAKPASPMYPMPASTGTAKNWAQDGWLNLLIVGADSGVGRWSLRTDTMILLRVDLSTGRAAMFGIPRNVYNVPLGSESAGAFACHCFPYPNMLNALYVYANGHPDQFPGGNVRGFRALEGAVGTTTGVPVDGSVVINLMGFVKLIDALGGVTINVPYRVQTLPDYPYPLPDGSGHIVLNIPPGTQHMNGNMALAFARARHVIGHDSDYYRMTRQQLVLVSLRTSVGHPCSLVPKVSGILGALKNTVWTDLPISAAPQLLAIAEHIGAGNTARYTLVPPDYPEFYTQSVVNKIRNTVAHGLDKVKPAGGGGGGFSC